MDSTLTASHPPVLRPHQFSPLATSPPQSSSLDAQAKTSREHGSSAVQQVSEPEPEPEPEPGLRASSTHESNLNNPSLSASSNVAPDSDHIHIKAPSPSLHNDLPQQEQSTSTTLASATEVAISPRRLRRKLSPAPGEPLPKISRRSRLPDVSKLQLLPEQLKKPLFVAIAQVLLLYGNVWQTATDLVDGIRRFDLATLSGPTPYGTVQGAISKALSLAGSLQTFEPLEKLKMNHATYYRLSRNLLGPMVLASPLHDSDTDATVSDAISAPVRRGVPNPRRTKRKTQVENSETGQMPRLMPAKRKPPPIKGPGKPSRNSKRKLFPGWSSDSLSSCNSGEDDADQSVHLQQRRTAKSTRARVRAPTGSSERARKQDSLPNGLKKLPKGYVYDTELNQAALMSISVNPSQTGEYMLHLKGKSAKANDDFLDRRNDFGVDLEQEPNIFAVEQQVGYTYPRLRNSGRERLPKGECEDGFAVADLQHDGVFLGRLFCITDGHGGRSCSSFVIATIPGAMQVILGKYKPADLSQSCVQEVVKSQITEAIRLIDKEYLEYKKQQYLLFRDKKLPNDPGSDGTTLIVNIFIDKWIICLNLGDSRSMLGSRDTSGRWNVEFHTEDHTPSLERLAQAIYANGGEFVTHDDKVIRFDPTLNNDKKHRQSLKEARIRVKDGESNKYGIPYRTKNGHCASVNLGACIGDILYKLDAANPILTCKPDITFIDVSAIQDGFLLMATDGLWDYVKDGGRRDDPNTTVCQFVGDKIDRGWNEQRIVCTLSDREGETTLYSDSIQEYDDFTAIIVRFSHRQLQEQHRRWQAKEQLQRMLEQQLLIRQQLMKERDIEEIQQMQQRIRFEQETESRLQDSKTDDETESESSTGDPTVRNSSGSSSTRTIESRTGLALPAGAGTFPAQVSKHEDAENRAEEEIDIGDEIGV
ncbi:hypothetical protein EC968_004811 [Mortierella alpina]|nr:hypothetical protein EC968_004811 [Mortierella alpina]